MSEAIQSRRQIYMTVIFPCYLSSALIFFSGYAAQNDISEMRTFFVATNGNDTWSGRIPDPARNKNDGPFASLPRALRAARETKQHQTSADSIFRSILIRRGTYFLAEPLTLTPADSGLIL